MVYDIDWKVKKLMPIGSGRPGSGIAEPNMPFTLPMKKLPYLNIPSSARFITTDTSKVALRIFLFESKRSINRPAQ